MKRFKKTYNKYSRALKNTLLICSLAITLPVMATPPQPLTHQHIANHQPFPAEGSGCLSCHNGIEPIRDPQSKMMQQIFAKGQQVGDPNGCVVCHGGNPIETTDKSKAHNGAPEGNAQRFFTPVPGALSVNDNTCGLCHEDHTYNVHRSIMNTDAGKIKAITWSWGIDTDTHQHKYGNHETDDPDGPTPRFGTDIYKNYMKALAEKFPDQFPTHLDKIPEISAAQAKAQPQLAAFNKLRNCNKCHLANKGAQDRGHFRGEGCAACHMLYSNEGFYEGDDQAIDKNKPGKPMVHTMQGTRKSKLTVNGQTVSGIQVSTCASCHAAGRRIGFAYQGMMALGHSDDRGPFDGEGKGQQTNAGYTYKYIRDDAHHRVTQDGKEIGGLLCQDCHTTNSMHGNGNIGATTLATIEIECSDCHGTPQQYPWELPFGFGDEFGQQLDMTAERGLADKPMKVTSDFATVYPKQDGYLYSTRGNPLGNVVKAGNDVILHSATGKDFTVPVLKQLELENRWTHPEKARVAMVGVSKHMESLECYACHATWAAQYYGAKDVIDFRKKGIDWIKSAEIINADGTSADHNSNPPQVTGVTSKFDYSHIRWEQPPLGINGEGRVSPLTGVIQTIGTVIGADGKPLMVNNLAKTPSGTDAMEMAPLNPHTATKEARPCIDCHGNTNAAGYGMEKGLFGQQADKPMYADAVTADGALLSRHSTPQIQAIPALKHDFSQILDANGKQLMTVDSHWPDSQPLTAAQRGKLDRQDTCIACHKGMPNMPDGSPAMTMLGHVAKVLHLSFANGDAHAHLLAENNIIVAWFKFVGIASLLLLPIPIIIYLIWRRRINTYVKKMLLAIAAKIKS
ncbi:cytochrome c [Shewanella sp. NFH-SH190041]|uniref:hypothetical protein n=1 Tax=Shewanella sp. NFH-SH190041 TaxID=2950245 RepID=UPI0021C2650F|nr:hypothetical protein [Shewanella sp. NFH-SH190041]BDM65746.1 cytochrome c [Shewanella sp. NFH-SH190041]